MSYIEEALEKAKALAKQAKLNSDISQEDKQCSDGLAARAEPKVGDSSVRSEIPAGGPNVPPHMQAQSEGRRLFFGGLSYDTTDQSLESYLNPKFPTEECRVKFDQEGRSRGFAFVSFYTKETLEECFQAQPHYIDGKKVELRKVSADGQGNWGGTSQAPNIGQKRPSMGMTRYPGGGGPNVTRVYIGSAPSDTSKNRGLGEEMSDEDLRSYFSQYGTVTGIAQHRWEDTGKKKGFGYIEFAEFEGAQASMGLHMVRGKALEVKAYTQGGSRGPSTAAPRIHPSYSNPGSSYNGGSSYGGGSSRGYEERTSGYGGGAGGYGNYSKRGRYEDGPSGNSQDSNDPQAMLAQMKQMMNQMQQMQNQMMQMASGPPQMSQQMQQMQDTMHGMMQNQNQYYGSNGGYSTTSASAGTNSGGQGGYGSSGGQGGYGGSGGYNSSDRGGYGGYSSQGYQYSNKIEYPKNPKPPGTDH